jgi:hypothetical protein
MITVYSYKMTDLSSSKHEAEWSVGVGSPRKNRWRESETHLDSPHLTRVESVLRFSRRNEEEAQSATTTNGVRPSVRPSVRSVSTTHRERETRTDRQTVFVREIGR